MKDPVLGKVRTVWAGTLVSVGVFYLALRWSPHPSTPNDPNVLFVFVALALTAAVASFALPPRLHRQGTLREALETRDGDSVITADSSSTTRRIFVDPDKARFSARRLYQSSLILSLALSESVALAGLLLGLRGFPEERTLPFFVASLALIALRYPKPNAPERMLETSARARFPEAAFPPR